MGTQRRTIDVVWEEFTKEMRILIENDKVLCISPYWRVFSLKRGCHDDLYEIGRGVRLFPQDLIEEPGFIRQYMKKNGDNLCGYNHDIFSKDNKAFVLELITPDWCDLTNVEGNTIVDEEDEDYEDPIVVSNAFRHSLINAPKVVSIIHYIRNTIFEDTRDMEFIGLLGADCFNPDLINSWIYGEKVYNLVQHLYLNSAFRRSDV